LSELRKYVFQSVVSETFEFLTSQTSSWNFRRRSEKSKILNSHRFSKFLSLFIISYRNCWSHENNCCTDPRPFTSSVCELSQLLCCSPSSSRRRR